MDNQKQTIEKGQTIQCPKEKGQTIQCPKDKGQKDKQWTKTLHKKLKIEQDESHKKPRVNLGAPEGLAVPASLVTPVMLLLNDITSSDIYGNCAGHQYT